MDDALGGVFVLRYARDIQRCFSVVVPLLLRGQSVHRFLAVKPDDERILDPLQEVYSSEAHQTREGNRRVHQPGEGPRLQGCDRCWS